MKIKHPIFVILVAIFTLSFYANIAFGDSNDRYVLVAGFLNETLIGYFDENISALKKNGVDGSHILVIKQPSKNPVGKNSETLDFPIKQFSSLGPEPLVIIAHSKGANEVLIWALRNPEFVRDHVRAIFMVQGAFGGSRLADFIQGHAHPLDANMPSRYRVPLEVMKLGGWHENKVAHNGLMSLTEDVTAKLWPTLLAQNPSSIGLIDKKIFYVLGTEDVSNLPLLTRPMGSYLSTYYGKDDGVVLIQDQMVQGIGHVLVTTEADHMGWFLPRPEGSVTALQREIFTTILFNYASSLNL